MRYVAGVLFRDNWNALGPAKTRCSPMSCFRPMYIHRSLLLENYVLKNTSLIALAMFSAVLRHAWDRQEEVVEENDQVQGEQGFAGPALGG